MIVALLLFSVGALAMASTGALIGRALNVDALRERAARIAANQIETLAAGCRDAVSGRRSSPQIESEWSVSRVGEQRIDIAESVSYYTPRGPRIDSYHAIVSCP